MPRRLVLLTGPFEAGLLLPHLEPVAGARPIRHAATREELDRLLAEDPAGTRLVAFCTAVIVPGDWLRRLDGPGYNIHPGPPNYPGRHPESWGAYDGVGRFGATLHEMAPRVDEGAIVDVEWIDMPDGAGQSEFGLRAFRAALTLLMRWSARLFGDERALPRADHAWSGRKTSHADLVAMCRIPPDLDQAEFDRRRRAFAQQPGSELVIDLHGLSFTWRAPEAVKEG